MISLQGLNTETTPFTFSGYMRRMEMRGSDLPGAELSGGDEGGTCSVMNLLELWMKCAVEHGHRIDSST